MRHHIPKLAGDHQLFDFLKKIIKNLPIKYNFRIIDHPDYYTTFDNRPFYDFSLLEMSNGFNLPILSNVAPACLPSIPRPSNVIVKNYEFLISIRR